MAIPGLKDMIQGGVTGLLDIFTTGAANVIEKFKADPTKALEYQKELEALKIQAAQKAEELAVKMEELALKREEAFLNDMKDARAREVAVATSEKAPLINKIIQPILALLLLGSCFVMWYTILFKDIPKEKEMLVAGIVGSLTTIAMGVVGYYFGSSIGSSNKQKQLDNIMNK